MSKKKKTKKKHIPQRTCVGCRSVQSKRSMIRIVRTPDGIFVDSSGKMAGRGTYLHEARSCWENGLKGPIGQALRTQLTAEDRQRLTEFMVSIQDATPE